MVSRGEREKTVTKIVMLITTMMMAITIVFLELAIE